MTARRIHVQPGGTQVGIPAARIPAGQARLRLIRKAQRGGEVAHRWGWRSLAAVCDAAAIGLTMLTIAEGRIAELEKSLAAAVVRLEWAEEPTRRTNAEDQNVLVARTATRTGVVGAQKGAR